MNIMKNHLVYNVRTRYFSVNTIRLITRILLVVIVLDLLCVTMIFTASNWKTFEYVTRISEFQTW